MRALNQSIREFEPARQLKHVEVEDKHEENWNLYLRQQYEIEHFDRRKLRRAQTEDKSGPFFDVIKEESSNTSHIEKPDRDNDPEGMLPEPQEDYYENSVEKMGERTPTELDTLDRNNEGIHSNSNASSCFKRSCHSEDDDEHLREEIHIESTGDDQLSDLGERTNEPKSQTFASDVDSAASRSDSELQQLENQSQNHHNTNSNNTSADALVMTPEDNVQPNRALCANATSLDLGSGQTSDICEDIHPGKESVQSDAYPSNREHGSECPGVECFKTPLSDSAVNGFCQDEE